MKYLTVYNTIKRLIGEGQYPAGSYLPKTLDLKKQFSVSLATIVSAMKLLKKDGLILRVKSKGTIVVDKSQRLPHDYSAFRVAILFENDVSSIMNAAPFRKIAEGIEAYLFRSKSRIKLFYLSINRLSQSEILDELEFLRIAGVIFFDTERHPLFQEIRKRKIPTVFCLSFETLGRVNSVTFDYFGISAMMINKALAVGARNFSFWGFTRNDVENKRELFDFLWNMAFSTQLKAVKGAEYSAMLYAGPDNNEENIRAEMRQFLDSHPESPAFVFRNRTLFEHFKSVYESAAGLHEITPMVFILVDWSEPYPMLNGKPVFRLGWDPGKAGLQTAKLLLSALQDKQAQPRTHLIEASLFPDG